jgi:hypothetical protein
MGGKEMRFNLRALALSAAVFWGLALLLTGLANKLWSGYGAGFLGIVSSIYPGYNASGSLLDLIVGTLYAIVDGAVGGLIFGWLYNLFLGQRKLEPSP